MALNNLFNTMKRENGIVKQLDQFLLKNNKHSDDGDRKNETNSPSSALGCSRANYYQRLGMEKDPIDPRVRRIFDNGHGVHSRLQGYLTDMGVLLMDEVPLHNSHYQIQGHTDGIMSLTGNKKLVEILEIKSINERQFSALKAPKDEHRAQSQVYMFCAEQHRLALKEKYPTHSDFKRSTIARKSKYRKLYLHLKEGAKYTREEKIRHKVNQHMLMDKILYDVVAPITKAVVLYECKNTQNLKEFVIEMNNSVMDEVLEKFEVSNKHWEEKTLPCRECKNKSEGRWCSYVNHCFE